MIRPLLIALLFCSILPSQQLFAQDSPTLLRHSYDTRPMDSLANPESDPGGPSQFAPLATGYYFNDNNPPTLGSPWTPSYTFIDTAGATASGWNRVLNGPNQRPLSDWIQPNSDGWAFFRNPENPSDTIDNAVAGPISIGFPFYFYGGRCDSFYISTNGLIGLSTRRYRYDANGNRIGYDPHSNDPRPHTTTAATDPTPDDDGWRHLAASTSGIRLAKNIALPVDTSIAMIAPLWGDCQLTELSKVSYRRDGTRLTIFLENLVMNGVKNVPMTATRQTPAPITEGSVHVSYQVVLDGADSSVQVNYVRFLGSYTDTLTNRILPAVLMFAANSTVGVQGRGGQHTNYLVDGGFGSVNNRAVLPLRNTLAVKFKQWRNVGRALKIGWLRPNTSNPKIFDRPVEPEAENKMELLFGNPLLDAATPLGIIENVSSDRQGIAGVHYTAQPMRYRVILRIHDKVNMRQPWYQQALSSRPLYPAEGKYGYANANPNRPNIDTIFFDPYVGGPEFYKLHRFTTELVVIPLNALGDTLSEEWPFDNRITGRLFGIRRPVLPEIFTFSDYDTIAGKVLPPVTRLVSLGAEVVDGDQATNNPPPPRGKGGKLGLSSAVLRLDRRDEQGNLYQGIDVGDTLISFPLNLSTTLSQAYLIFSYQRGAKQSYARGWSDDVRVGPEGAVYNTRKDQFFQKPDALVVEFAEPSPDGLQNIANPTQWRDAEFRDSVGRLTWGQTSPRWGVFGGGGGSGTDTSGRIIVDEMDAGKDFQFYRAVIPIPTRWQKSSTGNKMFRFRLRLVANDHSNPDGLPNDDDDPFFVDNLMVLEEPRPEIEIFWVKAEWPYTQAPASQSSSVPIAMCVANNGGTAGYRFGVIVAIQNLDNPPSTDTYSYYRYQAIVSVAARGKNIVQFPTWDARNFGCDFPPPDSPFAVRATRYRITARVWPSYDGSYLINNETHSDFSLTLGPALAYDDGTNDVPEFAKQQGRGLNLSLTANDFNGQTPFGSQTPQVGMIALRYHLRAADTLYGFQAYFGQASTAPDEVSFSVIQTSANPSDPPATGGVAKANLLTKRGLDSPSGEYHYGRYVTYLLPSPVILDSGAYFLVAATSATTSNPLQLGADASRMGSVTTVGDDDFFDHRNNVSIPIHPELREAQAWATAQGEWQPMQPINGHGVYPHLNWRGDVAGFPTYQRGGWMPMLRLWFGSRSSTSGFVSDVQQAASLRSTHLRSVPNPTYGLVQITLPTPLARGARLEIVDPLGNIVRSYEAEALHTGVVLWDGADNTGRMVAAGTYRCRLVGEGVVESVMVVRL